ncbi:Pycsar system effector family protein [Streptomyces sp. NPDC004330]|uniref:Pycsar system effector family protein n=1 Tax=Streptomyces sp. NPDC004330 TaxID=3364700 RepID=UPI0036B48F7B
MTTAPGPGRESGPGSRAPARDRSGPPAPDPDRTRGPDPAATREQAPDPAATWEQAPGPAPDREQAPGPAPDRAAAPGPPPAAVPAEELRFMAERLLATVREDIGRADTKAAILLSGALAFLAVVFSGDRPLPPPAGPGLVLLLLAGALWTTGVLMLVSVVLPRTRIGADRTFLRDLTGGPSETALRERLSAPGADATGWLLEQASVHGLVLAAKYRWLRLGVSALALGALLALFSELW